MKFTEAKPFMLRRNLEIDRLRAIAIIITMYGHLNGVLLGESDWYLKMQPLWNASIGVYIFFAISGYLISSTLLVDLDHSSNKRAALLRFWTRRFTRIVPLALIWIFIPLVLSAVFNSRGIFNAFETNLPAAIAAALYSFNVYVSLAGSGSIYGPYWSLSLEEQFYLIFPILSLLIRGCVLRFVGLTLALVGMSFVPGWLGALRMDGLIFGVGLYILTANQPVERFPRSQVHFVTGWLVTASLVFLLVVLPYALSWLGLSQFMLLSFGTVSALMVFLALQERGWILPLGPRASIVLDWIGTRSFGLYLIHLPAYMAAGEITWRLQRYDNPSGRGAIALMLIVIATELSFRYVETPARRWGRSFAFEGKGTLQTE